MPVNGSFRDFRKTMLAQGDEVRLDAYINGYRSRFGAVITSISERELYVMPMVNQYYSTPDDNTDYAEVVECQLKVRTRDVIGVKPIRVTVGSNPPRNGYMPDGQDY